jgi:ABC-type multidrug transport system ATPase subunit
MTRSTRPPSRSRRPPGQVRASGANGSAAAPTARPALKVDGLAKRYGEVQALEPLDLTVERGERLALIGHNGSGKTTLIKMLCGLLEPSAGTAQVAGQPIAALTTRAAVSYLADEPVFYDDLSVIEHLEFIARLHGRDDWETDGETLLELLGLRERADDLPNTFSRGLRQKTAISLAFIRPFEVMLVDEPFVGLDRNGREALLALFAEAQGAGATLVVATHELSSISSSDRVVALANGSVTHDGVAEGINLVELTNRTSDPTPPQPQP